MYARSSPFSLASMQSLPALVYFLLCGVVAHFEIANHRACSHAGQAKPDCPMCPLAIPAPIEKESSRPRASEFHLISNYPRLQGSIPPCRAFYMAADWLGRCERAKGERR